MAEHTANGIFQIGHVVEKGVDGFEPPTPGLGWVCVEVGGKNPEVYWMRCVLPYASKKFGLAVYPEIGDQVLTVRIGGGEYMCLGSVYHAKNEAKVSNDEGNDYGKNFIKEFRTRAGNAIVIGDEDDKEFIHIDVKEGKMSMKMDIGGKSITVDGGTDTKNFDVIAKDAVLKVLCKDLHVKAGDATIDLKSGKIDVKGAKITVVSDGEVSVKAGGKVVIKGSAVEIC